MYKDNLLYNFARVHWETQQREKNAKRCFSKFATYISRMRYTNGGRIYYIICPQQRVWLGNEICLNIEITVSGQRSWVDEKTKKRAADMTIEGKIWL